jgi:hypothetical protein
MACPQVVDGEDSFHIWKIAENILNKIVAYSQQGVALQLGSWACD